MSISPYGIEKSLSTKKTYFQQIRDSVKKALTLTLITSSIFLSIIFFLIFNLNTGNEEVLGQNNEYNNTAKNAFKSELKFSQISISEEVFFVPEFILKKTHSLGFQISNILGDEAPKYGIYIEDLEHNNTLGINHDKIFMPASIFKVPLAMLVLKDIDEGIYDLETEFTVLEKDKIYDFDALSIREGNYKIQIKDLLNYLIRQSDNTAMTTLERELGGYNIIQSRIKNELKVSHFTRVPQQLTAIDTGTVLKKLYNQSYLSKNTNDYLLDLMKNVIDVHQDRIQAGVPEEIIAAHKIGTLNTVYQDAGIVYCENDFIIVVLNKDISHGEAREKIQKITSIVYDTMVR